MKQLIQSHTCEEVIKKSTFISIVAPVCSVDEVKCFLDKHSNFDATHNCWAYKIGQIYRFNDDGEPSGTAGKPMYNAIDGQDFDNTVALVIRHYGGIKLGTGGLMRAYGGGISRCLQDAKFETIQDVSEIKLKIPFAYIQGIHNLAKQMKATILTEEFNEEGALIAVNMLSTTEKKFITAAINLSKGTIKIIKTEP